MEISTILYYFTRKKKNKYTVLLTFTLCVVSFFELIMGKFLMSWVFLDCN